MGHRATNSVVTKSLARALSLSPISIVKVNHAGGTSDAHVYLVNIYLPNGLNISAVRVTECEDTGGNWAVIIGMDIICLGDFAITNMNRRTVVSYRYPSVLTIDYVEEDSRLKKKGVFDRIIGPNEFCPCGSGQKFKNCHGATT